MTGLAGTEGLLATAGFVGTEGLVAVSFFVLGGGFGVSSFSSSLELLSSMMISSGAFWVVGEGLSAAVNKTQKTVTGNSETWSINLLYNKLSSSMMNCRAYWSGREDLSL